MVAQASLLASERPFRVSGSGGIEKSVEEAFVALTRRAAERRRRRAIDAESGRSCCGSNAEHAGGSLNRAVNPGII